MATRADPTLVGVLNLSPESMVRESIATTPEEILARAAFLKSHGCSLLDLGGRSITPDAPVIDDEEEQSRLLPALDLLTEAGYAVSVDTWSAGTARRCLDQGAVFVNFTGSELGAELLGAVAAAKAGLVITYMPYGDAYRMRGAVPIPYRLLAIVEYLEPRVRDAREAGIAEVVVDPNLGIIHPSVDDHMKIHLQHEVLFHLDEVRALGCPILLYAARKPERLARIMMASAVLQVRPEYVRTHHPDMLQRLLAAAQDPSL
jgi:dihydropteroate synthase